MNLSIIIPHLKGKTILNECIQSIYDTLDSIEYELIIVNNNCQDNSIEYIAKKFSQCKIIDSNINLGYAGGCNLGAKNASGKYLLFLNDDTIITKNCISELINTIEKNNNISSVQPKIKNYFEKNYFDYAGGCGGYIDYLGYPFVKGRLFDTIEKDTGQYDKETKIFWASGTGFLTSSDVFRKIKGFDESLFAHMEEIDYHWKCLMLGYDIYIQPNAVLYHKGGQTLPYGSFKKIFLNHRNSMILFITNNLKLSLINLIKRITLEKLTIIFYALKLNIKGSFAVLLANLWLIINLKYIVVRKRNNVKTYKNNKKISNELMKKYSIVKKYYINKKKKFSNVN